MVAHGHVFGKMRQCYTPDGASDEHWGLCRNSACVYMCVYMYMCMCVCVCVVCANATQLVWDDFTINCPPPTLLHTHTHTHTQFIIKKEDNTTFAAFEYTVLAGWGFAWCFFFLSVECEANRPPCTAKLFKRTARYKIGRTLPLRT